MNRVAVLMFVILTYTAGYTQTPTVGLVYQDSLVSDGYTLLTSFHSTDTYLIDNCGFVVHSWESDYYAGHEVKLLENGKLLRTGQINSPYLLGGGAGGRIEILNWDGSIDWEFSYISPEYRSHHDALQMPNGNIMFIAWDKRRQGELLAAGKNPEFLQTDSLNIWSDHLIEVKPLENNGYEIVWEWYAFDHLVQDYDSTKENYGVVHEHPELININFIKDAVNPDWLHFNAIDYNEELDQIIISVNKLKEFWIIDHSTTTEEASGHTGGNSGKGGDLLYRFGNPITYNQGTLDDKVLFNLHTTHWVGDANNQILLFNNGAGRQPRNSAVEYYDLPLVNGLYTIEEDSSFTPAVLTKQYNSVDIGRFKFSRGQSGAYELENGNIIICSSASGNIVEITPEGDPVWHYISPITNQGIVEQGFDMSENAGVENLVFRAHKYPPNYPGLYGRNLISSDRIELNPLNIAPCEDKVTSISVEDLDNDIKLFPNPADDNFIIQLDGNRKIDDIMLYDLFGKTYNPSYDYLDKSQLIVNISNYSSGTYYLRIISEEKSYLKKVVISK